MIVAIVMAFIFLMLVLTVSVLSTTAYKRAYSRRDRAIALNLAEAGLADGLYRVNYKNYTGAYGTPSECVIPEINFAGGTYEVTESGGELTSTGTYRGKRRIIKVKVRNPVDDANTGGIAEVFNKHVIYAKKVEMDPTETATIKGNIARVTLALIDAGTNQYTATKISSCEPPSLGFTVDSVSAPTFGGPTTITIRDDDGTGPPYTPGADPIPGNINYWGDGMDETYTLITGCSLLANTRWRFEKAATDTLKVIVQNDTAVASTGFLEVINGGSIELKFDGANNPNLQGVVKADGNIDINSGVASPNPIGVDGYSETVLYAGGSIDIDYSTGISGPVINGDVLAVGTITLQGPKVKGSVLSASNINLATAASAIYGTSSTKKAPIIVNSSSSAVSITIGASAAPKIYLDDGTNNKAAIIAYSSGLAPATASVTINDDIITDGSSNAVIIAYTENVGGAGNASINVTKVIGNDIDVNACLFASSDTGNGNITIDNNNLGGTDEILGVIVANNDVKLEDNAKVSWDSSVYKSSTLPLYGAFTGGRRVYLPVIGSWKEVK